MKPLHILVKFFPDISFILKNEMGNWKFCLFLKISQIQSTLETLINFSRTLFYNDLLKGNLFFILSSQKFLYDFFSTLQVHFSFKIWYSNEKKSYLQFLRIHYKVKV